MLNEQLLGWKTIQVFISDELKSITQELAAVLQTLRTGIDVAITNGKTIRFSQKTLVRIDAILDQYSNYLTDEENK
jgi:hypothetical protein